MPDPVNSAAVAVSAAALDRLRETLDLDSLLALGAAKSSRIPRTSHPRVIETAVSPVSQLGAVALYLAPVGSDILARIAEACDPPQPELLETLRQEMVASYAQRTPVAFPDAVREMTGAPALIELRYGSKVLVDGVGLREGLPFGMTVFAHAGGKLDAEKFALLEYPRDESVPAPAYEALVLVTPPALTDFEKELIGRIPATESELLLADEESAVFPGLVVTALLFTIAATLMHTPMTGAGGAEMLEAEDVGDSQMTPELAQQLGDRAAVKEMVNARRRVLSALRAN